MTQHHNVLELVTASGERAERDLFQYVSLTPAQTEFYEHEAQLLLWRDGNQLGKSMGLAYWVLSLVLGVHPSISRNPPVSVLVISYSIEQMEPLMEKLWMLSPKHVPGIVYDGSELARLDAKCGWDPGRGITGKPPRLTYTNGSKVLFGTYKQGSRRVAGGTYHAVVMDEPPSETVFGEVVPRLLRNRGHLRIVFTPVPDMPDMQWLWDKVDSPTDRMAEVNFGLTEEAVWPVGWPCPWLSEEDIEEYAEDLLETERNMRIRGDRTPLVKGVWFKFFDEATHVVDVDCRDLPGWYLIGSWDHGTVAGKQVFSLVAIKDRHTDRPQIVILDEKANEGFTTPTQDAEAMLEVLDNNGLEYDHVDDWAGDVPAGSKRWEVRKSNTELRKEIARLLGRRVQGVKQIHPPRKHKRSMTLGMRALNTLFKWGCLRVNRRCVGFIAGVKTFKGDPRDPNKDSLDAPRYGIERACTGQINRMLNSRY